MKLNQILASASPGDAITSFALELRTILAEFGDSAIYARHVHAELLDEISPLDSFPQSSRTDDLILFHASIGEADVFQFLLERPERLYLIYHNISPEEAFLPYDPAFAKLLREGRDQLEALRDRTAGALADSAFNARELEGIGYQDVRVSPLILNTARLTDAETDPLTARHFEEMVKGPLVLFVGQLLPHKRPEVLVKMFHLLQTYLVPESSLAIVGWARLPRFRTALQLFISELNLTRAWIAERVTVQQLAAYYRRADLFVTMSEHEGFCAPVIEAMAFDTPVIARRFGALPETVGQAGIMLSQSDSPAVAAEASAAVLTDEDLRVQLISRGRERVEEHHPQVAASIFRGHIEEILTS